MISSMPMPSGGIRIIRAYKEPVSGVFDAEKRVVELVESRL